MREPVDLSRLPKNVRPEHGAHRRTNPLGAFAAVLAMLAVVGLIVGIVVKITVPRLTETEVDLHFQTEPIVGVWYPFGSVRRAPTAQDSAEFEHVKRCTGWTADFSKIRFWDAPMLTCPSMAYCATCSCLGNHRIIGDSADIHIKTEQLPVMYRDVLRHELIHYLQYYNGLGDPNKAHDDLELFDKCGAHR